MEVQARVHWVDWLKVFAVAAIFLYHVCLVFSFTPWMISNREHSLVLSGIAGWGYLWGLQLLFVLAGASSYYARRRRSAARFAGERLLRLGVPFVVGFVTLSPLQAYWQSLGKGSTLSLGEFLPGYLAALRPPTDPVWLIRHGYHLWFLGFLLLISLAALPLQAVLRRLAAEVRGRLSGERRWPAAAALLPVLAMAAVQYLLRPAYPSDMSWPDLVADLVFYLGGYALAGSPQFQAAVRAAPALWCGSALAAWSGLGVMFLLDDMPGWTAPYGYGLDSLALALVHACGAWAWTLFLVSLAMRLLDRSHPAISYGNDAILPFYVLHHPVVVALALWIVPLSLPVWPKFALLLLGGFSLTLAVYEVAIRHFAPLRFLFGLSPKKPTGPPSRGRSADAVAIATR